jgi:hypothetical protein
VKTIATHGTFEQAIEGSNPKVQAIARRLRELLQLSIQERKTALDVAD